MELCDTHCHLFLEPLAARAEAALERARVAGVSRVVVPAYDSASWERVEELGARPGVAVAYGLHPWVADEPLDLERLEALLHGAVALGEIGLDFAIDSPDRRRQIDVLQRQLDLARRLDLPVILHCRRAFDALFALLREHGPLRGVLHAFSRGAELAERAVRELDLHIAIGGAATRPGALRARQSAAAVPQRRLLLETDAPSCGMEGLAAGETEPRDVVRVAEVVAALRAEPLEAVAEETTQNARSLFALP